MIIRPRPNLPALFFVMRGSIVPRIAPQLIGFAIYASLVVLLVRALRLELGTYGIAPFALVGITLSIYLGFRNNAAYDRWWEARRLWGTLIFEIRNLARVVVTRIDDAAARRTLLESAAAFSHALRGALRGVDSGAEVRALAGAAAPPASSVNPCDVLLRGMGARVADLRRAGALDAMDFRILDERLAALAAVQAGCERIASTPVPFAYTLLLHRSAWVFCLLLPFGLAGPVGWATPLFTVLLAYSFFGLDALSEELEDPFGIEANDLPLDALCRICEISVREALGDPPPPALLPTGYQLT